MVNLGVKLAIWPNVRDIHDLFPLTIIIYNQITWNDGKKAN